MDISVRQYSLVVLLAVFVVFLSFGCMMETSDNSESNSSLSETDESIAAVSSDNEKRKLAVAEKRAQSLKKADKLRVAKADKKSLQLQKNRKMIAGLISKLQHTGYFCSKNNPEKQKTALEVLSIIEKYNSNDVGSCKSILMLKTAQVLHVLCKTEEAHKFLLKHWPTIMDFDKKNNSDNIEYPELSAEAYYLKGNIELSLAKNTSDNNKSRDYYKTALKAYYSVLRDYDAHQCVFSAASVKGYTECRKNLWKHFRIKVGFPPEF